MENEILCGDIMEIAPTLPDNSIRLVLTSPPYANQRQDWYPSIPEKEYPSWTTSWLAALRPKLLPDANILIIIRAHQKDGEVSDYVLRTRLAIRDAGWHEPEELIWNKSDGPPIGSTRRPRRCWEHFLWYSPTNRPYVDLLACGNVKSKRCGGFVVGKERPTSGNYTVVVGAETLRDFAMSQAENSQPKQTPRTDHHEA